MGFLIGQTVGDYLVSNRLDSGDAGQLYEVEHTITRRRESMKILAGEKSCPAEQADSFFRQIRLQASLSHPNIASVHNAFWSDEDLVLVSELLYGESLQTVLARERLSVNESLNIISQVLRALSHAHAHGVIHGDVSPASIFLNSDRTVKLMNFGLIKKPSESHRTKFDEGGHSIDLRRDLHSCGVVLYEMVTGVTPFVRENHWDGGSAWMEQAPLSARAVDPAIPKAIDRVIHRALAGEVDQGFQSADAFLSAVAELRQRFEAKTFSGPTLTRPSVVMALVAVGLVSLLGFMAGGARLIQSQSQSQSRIASPPAEVVVKTPSYPLAPLPKQKISIPPAAKKQPAATALATPVNPASAIAVDPTITTAVNPTSPTSVDPATAPAVDPAIAKENSTSKSPFGKFARALKRINPVRRKATSGDSKKSGTPVEGGNLRPSSSVEGPPAAQ